MRWGRTDEPGRSSSDPAQRNATGCYDAFVPVLSQISFLHVYHHATTFFPVWALNVHYGPGGEAYYCCALNSFVHVVMYGYYTLAGLGVRVRAKKLVTQLQMVQFLTYIFQGSYDLITGCYKPRIQCVFVTVREREMHTRA